MGLFDFLGGGSEDRSLVEISNDNGDHIVADIPTSGVKETEKALRQAGVQRDHDEELLNVYRAYRVVEDRDSGQFRFRTARVVDENEDLEDTHDREKDQPDDERSEQRSNWWPF